MVNLGSLILVRKSEQRRLERLVANHEANNEAPQSNPADVDSDEDLERRNQDAINDAIYQMGYDPTEYHRALEEGRDPGKFKAS